MQYFSSEGAVQDNTGSSTHPGNLIPTWSSDDVTGERNEPVKPLQPLNKDQKPKDRDQVAGECITEKEDRIHQVYSHTALDLHFSCLNNDGRRKQTESSGEMRQFQEATPLLLPSLPSVENMDVTMSQKDTETQSRVIAESVSSWRISVMLSSTNQPLSARGSD